MQTYIYIYNNFEPIRAEHIIRAGALCVRVLYAPFQLQHLAALRSAFRDGKADLEMDL